MSRRTPRRWIVGAIALTILAGCAGPAGPVISPNEPSPIEPSPSAATSPPTSSTASSPSGAPGSPLPSIGATPTTGPSPTRPPVIDLGPVPPNLRPPLASAKRDVPVIYTDGCHLGFLATVPGRCVFGDPAGSTTVVLLGDSKAGQWFPALDRLATARGWRLVSMTKSACTAADIAIWNSALNRVYTECATWRVNALARIAALRPSVVVVSDDRLYELALGSGPTPVADHVAAWDAGLGRTLSRLRQLARAVVLLGDTPRSKFDVPICLEAHLTDAGACATPVRVAIDAAWLAADRATAVAAGATLIDPSPWVCPADPCPPIINGLLVDREQDHMTATFAASLAGVLGAALDAAVGPPG